MAFCSKCGNQLIDGAKFCPKCGTPSSNGTKPCPKCGILLVIGAKFCPNCGSSIEGTKGVSNASANTSTCSIELISAGYSALPIVKLLNEQLGYDIEEANNLVDSTPCEVAKDLSLTRAKEISQMMKKDGAEVVVKKEGTPISFIESPQDDENAIDNEEQATNNNKKWIIGVVCAIGIVAACYLFGAFDGGETETSNIPPKALSVPKTSTPQSSTDNSQKEKMERQKDEAYNRKAMEYANQIQQIFNTINNIYSEYVAYSISYPDMKQRKAVNAMADISSLKMKGDRLWDKLIDLAREYKKQDAISELRSQKKYFDDEANRLDRSISVDNYGY
jgi:ribosomal protein L7/L12